jgi:hypothetical protein
MRLPLCLLALSCLLLAPCASAGSAKQLLQAPSPATDPAGGATPAAVTAPATAPGGGDCCQQLAALGFSSNLPVVVLDTGGKQLEVKGEEVPVRMCTCSPAGESASGRRCSPRWSSVRGLLLLPL